MRIIENVIAAVLLHFFLFTAPSTAEIISLKLRSDNEHMILFSEFKFSHDGYLSFLIPSMTVTSSSSRPDPSRIGFVLQSREMRDNHSSEFQQNTVCALDFNNSVIFTFQDLFHDPQYSSFNKSYPVTYPGMYSLFFVNCNRESQVTMEGRAELYNIDGTTKNYLSAELTKLPFLYFFSSFIYLCFLGFWILLCFKNPSSFHRMHLLMGGLLVMNLVQLICAAANLYYLKVTGTPNVLDVLFCTLRLIKTVLLFAVIVLIGTGWCFWKSLLEGKEKVFLMIVILLQVLANVFFILGWKAGIYINRDRIDWIVASHAIDFLGCIASFVPTVLSIMSLNEIRETIGNAVVNEVKLRLFAIVFGAYVVFTRLAIVEVFIPWVNYGVQEISLLVFCMAMFYIYRPSDVDDDHKAIHMTASCFCCSC